MTGSAWNAPRKSLRRHRRSAPSRTNSDGDEVELVTPGVDDFSVDENGQLYCGTERIGGPDVIDEHDPSTDSAFKSLQLSPRDQQLIGQHVRDESGRFTRRMEPPPPMITEPCRCGSCVDICKANIIGSAYDTETQQAYVRHLCKCGEERLTYADGIPDSVQAKAIENDEIMNEILGGITWSVRLANELLPRAVYQAMRAIGTGADWEQYPRCGACQAPSYRQVPRRDERIMVMRDQWTDGLVRRLEYFHSVTGTKKPKSKKQKRALEKSFFDPFPNLGSPWDRDAREWRRVLFFFIQILPMNYFYGRNDGVRIISCGLNAIFCCGNAEITRPCKCLRTTIMDLNGHIFYSNTFNISDAMKGRNMGKLAHLGTLFQYFHRVQRVHRSPSFWRAVSRVAARVNKVFLKEKGSRNPATP